jgi:hypothetical protein
MKEGHDAACALADGDGGRRGGEATRAVAPGRDGERRHLGDGARGRRRLFTDAEEIASARHEVTGGLRFSKATGSVESSDARSGWPSGDWRRSETRRSTDFGQRRGEALIEATDKPLSPRVRRRDALCRPARPNGDAKQWR